MDKKLVINFLFTFQHITNRLKTLELDWMDFETWLASNEEKIHVLNNTLGRTGVNMTEQLKEAQVRWLGSFETVFTSFYCSIFKRTLQNTRCHWIL